MTISSLILSMSLLIACNGDDGDETGTDMDGGSSDGGSGDGGSGDGGSGDGGSGDGGSGDGGSAETARVRVMHGSPDAPAVDIWVKGGTSAAVTDLAFGEVTGFLDLPAGTYDFEVKVSPSDADDVPVYSTGDLALADGVEVTALAAGLVGSTDAANSFRVIPLVENWAAAEAGSYRVRIVHAGADAPPVAVDVGNDGTPEITDFGLFGDTEAVAAGGIALPADTDLQVGIWAGDPLGRVTAFTIPALPEGTEVLVVAGGLLARGGHEANGFQLLAVPGEGSSLSIGQNPKLYALHGSPNAPAVDIFAGEAELVSNAAFGQISGAIQVPPGSYDLDVFVASDGSVRPDGAPVATLNTGSLEGGQTYLAMANGFVGGTPELQLLAWADGFNRDDSENARVRVVHGSPDAPAVEVGPVVSGAVSSLGAFGFGQDSGAEGISLGTAPVTIGLALEGTTAPVVSFDLDLTGFDGARVFAIASGALMTSGSAGFRLLLVDTTVEPWAVIPVFPN